MNDLVILKSRNELDNWLKSQRHGVAFVPTMGNLHEGHQKLIKESLRRDETKTSSILISIFVNQIQFGPNEDFINYPRTLEEDCTKAKEAGANALWAPEIEDLYPNGYENYFKITPPASLTNCLCGRTRPGHFSGVSNVVLRLINIIQPKYILLGEKDWQQTIIIKNLIKDINLKSKVINVPTYRDKDGLPLSSRNGYLNRNQRKVVSQLPKLLLEIKDLHLNHKKIETSLTIKQKLMKYDFEVEYVDIVNPETLETVHEITKICLLCVAIKIGKSRLIDHVFLMNKLPIIAIDGPAGAGKSTITKIIAKKLGLKYLDTGAMYRAVTWLILENKIDTKDEESISKLISNMKIKLSIIKNGEQNIFINNNNVTKEIRSPYISSKVSEVATHKVVRVKLTSYQKELGNEGGIVAEGRDIGTSVFPDADLKIYLTASPQERAKRRLSDLNKQGFKNQNLAKLESEISKRDEIDSKRKLSPLTQAKDAKVIDTDGLSINEVVDKIIDIFRLNVPEEEWPSP